MLFFSCQTGYHGNIWLGETEEIFEGLQLLKSLVCNRHVLIASEYDNPDQISEQEENISFIRD